jgi:hypothetical protein
VTARSAATAAENRPVYGVLVYAQDNMSADTRTHENEDRISIFLPALDHLVVLFLCGFGVYGEERPRAVTEIGFPLQRLIRCQLRVVVVAVCCRYYKFGEDRSNMRVIL